MCSYFLPYPQHSPPAQSCPALHLWEANWLRGTCGLCGSPQGSSPSRRRAWPRASFYLPPLCAFASVSKPVLAGGINRPRPAPPPPGVLCVAGGQGGASGKRRKGPPPRLLGWLRGSCEDSSTQKRRKAKAAETSQEELAENRAHQIRRRGREGETRGPGMNGEQTWRGERRFHRSDWI